MMGLAEDEKMSKYVKEIEGRGVAEEEMRMVKFEVLHSAWFERHLSLRVGERRRRLEEGHAHAEKIFAQHIWWQSFCNFDFLHPEYEVYDFRDGRRFLDFAWVYGWIQLAIEIDGFTTHVKLDRNKFSDHLRRQNDLVNDGWKILRFTYDDIKDRPRSCQQLLQQFMGRWAGAGKGDGSGFQQLNVLEREIVRMASRRVHPFGISEIKVWLDVQRQTAAKLASMLLEKDWIIPHGLGDRGKQLYTLNRTKEILF